jgi:hypothetical protein
VLVFKPPPLELTEAYEKKKDHFLTFEYKTYYAKSKKRKGSQFTVQELIDIINQEPDKFKDERGAYNASLIHSYTEVAINRCNAAAKRLNKEHGLLKQSLKRRKTFK